ncbi:GNAT family N-acetyltransferase [Candidatus Omnitrophota bacterium]
MKNDKLMINGQVTSASGVKDAFDPADAEHIIKDLSQDDSACYAKSAGGSYGVLTLSLNPYDTRFFSQKIGNVKYYGGEISDTEYRDLLSEILRCAKEKKYKYLYYKLPEAQSFLKDATQNLGFDLCITNIDFCLDFKNWQKNPEVDKPGYVLRESTVKDTEAVQEITSDAFRRSRLYQTGFIPTEEVDEYHRQWVKNIIDHENDTMFLVEKDGKVCGYLSIEVDADTRTSRFLLGAVEKSERRQGLWHILVQACFEKASRGADCIYAKTQESNVPSVTCWRNYGFEELGHEYGYHKIF